MPGLWGDEPRATFGRIGTSVPCLYVSGGSINQKHDTIALPFEWACAFEEFSLSGRVRETGEVGAVAAADQPDAGAHANKCMQYCYIAAGKPMTYKGGSGRENEKRHATYLQAKIFHHNVDYGLYLFPVPNVSVSIQPSCECQALSLSSQGSASVVVPRVLPRDATRSVV